jgi:riboflavin biosynthesis pyrimidine reductase
MEFRQLLPEAGSIEIADLLDALGLDAASFTDRPRTIANFITSADGRATIGGRSGPLGDDGDHALFHGLRERVDAVLAGTGTLRVERYGRVLGKAERRRRRVQRGQPPEPLAVVITHSGEIPTAIPLFQEPESRILVFSAREIDFAGTRAQIELIQVDPAELTLTAVMRRLRAEHEVRSLLCEGGPTLFCALLHEGLVDELFLTTAPKLVGGGHELTMTVGPELAEPVQLRLIWLLERNYSLYHRYSLS